MERKKIELALAAVIDAESATGIRWWPGVEMAPIAYRRWHSFARRYKSKDATRNHRIHDLAKGLQAHFEPDVPYTHPAEWEHLSRKLAEVLEAAESKA